MIVEVRERQLVSSRDGAYEFGCDVILTVLLGFCGQITSPSVRRERDEYLLTLTLRTHTPRRRRINAAHAEGADNSASEDSFYHIEGVFVNESVSGARRVNRSNAEIRFYKRVRSR